MGLALGLGFDSEERENEEEKIGKREVDIDLEDRVLGEREGGILRLKPDQRDEAL